MVLYILLAKCKKALQIMLSMTLKKPSLQTIALIGVGAPPKYNLNYHFVVSSFYINFIHL